MTDREILARALREFSKCGAMVGGEVVFCDDPRLARPITCDCHEGADMIQAALAAAGKVIASRAEIDAGAIASYDEGYRDGYAVMREAREPL